MPPELSEAPFPLPELAQSVTRLPGVGPAMAARLAARDIRTWGDLLFLLPARYEDRRTPTPIGELLPGRTALVAGWIVSSAPWGRKGKVWRLAVEDATGRIPCLWFRFKRPQMEAWAPDTRVFLAGTVQEAPQGGLQFTHPEVYPAAGAGPDHPHLFRLLPIYPETGLPAGILRRVMAELASRTAPSLPDPLWGLLPRELYPFPAGEALQKAHLPPPDAPPEDLDPARAAWRRVLALNELFYYELGLSLKRRSREARTARPLDSGGELFQSFLAALPFRLTEGQERALEEIRRDLARPRPMGRLLAGDVGTGKTAVAAGAAVLAAGSGAQTALMAPTEVLAKQHLATLERMLSPLGLGVALLSGSQNGAKRRESLEMARNGVEGGAAVLVGTHALFSKGVDFAGLGLVIVDEQHRFGVHQRLSLAAKGDSPHLLVLSATPIPRTLSLALSGHLDISGLPQKPGGGPQVETLVFGHGERRAAVEAMGRTLARGERVYVICPLVEASEAVEARDAVDTHRRLMEYFPGVPMGLAHGRLTPAKQEEALARFRSGENRVLVATTVVEVGVDVPEATLMIVLGAERFGLTQLHQLRGRVGRGGRPGLCCLVAGPEPGEAARERLAVLARTSDGLEVARADLGLRGPGQALGIRQAGLPVFRAADWREDHRLLESIHAAISARLAADPGLLAPEHREVRAEALRRWGRRLGLMEAG